MAGFDELVKQDGVLMAGRFGPDGRIAEQKTVSLLIEGPKAVELMSAFCASIQATLNTMAIAMSGVGFESWQPLNGWGVSSGHYSFAVHGDRFMLAESEKLGNIDELIALLRRQE